MVKKSEKLLRKIHHLLKKGFRDIPGVFVENKKATLSVHYRNVPASFTKLVAKKTNQLVQAYPKELRLTLGKRVYEIRPKTEWDMGKALLKVYSMIPWLKKRFEKIYWR
jgi:trehalose-phosphatase